MYFPVYINDPLNIEIIIQYLFYQYYIKPYNMVKIAFSCGNSEDISQDIIDDMPLLQKMMLENKDKLSIDVKLIEFNSVVNYIKNDTTDIFYQDLLKLLDYLGMKKYYNILCSSIRESLGNKWGSIALSQYEDRCTYSPMLYGLQQHILTDIIGTVKKVLLNSNKYIIYIWDEYIIVNIKPLQSYYKIKHDDIDIISVAPFHFTTKNILLFVISADKDLLLYSSFSDVNILLEKNVCNLRNYLLYEENIIMFDNDYYSVVMKNFEKLSYNGKLKMTFEKSYTARYENNYEEKVIDTITINITNKGNVNIEKL